MALQHAGGTAENLKPAVTRNATEPHHGAARTARGRRVVGEDDLRADFSCNLDETLGDRGRARVDVHDARPEAGEHGTKRVRRVFVRLTIGARKSGF
jgi:hypothetical protein